MVHCVPHLRVVPEVLYCIILRVRVDTVLLSYYFPFEHSYTHYAPIGMCAKSVRKEECRTLCMIIFSTI